MRDGELHSRSDRDPTDESNIANGVVAAFEQISPAYETSEFGKLLETLRTEIHKREGIVEERRKVWTTIKKSFENPRKEEFPELIVWDSVDRQDLFESEQSYKWDKATFEEMNRILIGKALEFRRFRSIIRIHEVAVISDLSRDRNVPTPSCVVLG